MNKSREAFRTISEVSDWLETPAHVLRFWESKFSQIRPVKGAGGRRYYRPEDMALLGGIKFLLHTQGLTIKGAQKLLREQGLRYVAALGPQPFEDEDTAPDMAQVPLHNVLAPAPMPVAAAMVAPPRHPVTTPALAAATPVAAPDASLPASETVTHEIVANPVMTAVADVTADIVMDAPIPAPRPLSAANLAEDQDVCDSAPQTEPKILPPAAESQAITEEISQLAATEPNAVADAPDTETAAITADDTESPADSVVQIRLTLRRPINEILIQTLMMGDRGVVLHRESLAALAVRLSDVRSRISIE